MRVAVLEDHLLLRQLLGGELERKFRVVVNTGSPDAFFSGIQAEPVTPEDPGVAIIDLSIRDRDGFPLKSGLEVTAELLRRRADWLPIVMSANGNPDVVSQTVQAGARAFLRKSELEVTSLISAIEAVARGERLFPTLLMKGPPEAHALTNKLKSLSAREREVLTLVARGDDNLKIGAILGITERTVKAHVAAIYEKLNVDNRTQAAIVARELGVWPKTE